MFLLSYLSAKFFFACDSSFVSLRSRSALASFISNSRSAFLNRSIFFLSASSAALRASSALRSSSALRAASAFSFASSSSCFALRSSSLRSSSLRSSSFLRASSAFSFASSSSCFALRSSSLRSSSLRSSSFLRASSAFSFASSSSCFAFCLSVFSFINASFFLLSVFLTNSLYSLIMCSLFSRMVLPNVSFLRLLSTSSILLSNFPISMATLRLVLPADVNLLPNHQPE